MGRGFRNTRCGGGGEGRRMVNRLPLHLVWPSRHLLYGKMTKEKSKEDIKYYFSFMKISSTAVTSEQNFIEKYQRLMKNFYNQNCQWKSRVSEICKIHTLHGFFLFQPTVVISAFKQNLQEALQTLYHSTNKRHSSYNSVRKTAP